MSSRTDPPKEQPGESPPDYAPPLRRRELEDAVVALREDDLARSAQDAERWRPRLEAHLATLVMILEELEADHQAIADQVEFDLNGDSRYAAVWQLSGRCIGLGKAVVALLRQGFCAETLALSRVLHECTRLVDAFEDPEDGDQLLGRWLADDGKDYVKPWEARAAERRADQRHREQMLAAGDAPVGESSHLSALLYDHLSWFGHNRRRATSGFVDARRITMVRGPHPDPVVVAEYVGFGGQVIEEALLSVGHALSRFLGAAYLRDRVLPLQAAIHATRRESPLR